jgi:GTP cyclohydrolase I
MDKIKSNENIFRTEAQKNKIIKNATKHYSKFLTSLGFDWENDPNMKETPHRVAKMFVRELYEGSFSEPPKITTFDNVDKYDGMVFQGNIKLHSSCSHHTLPFVGVANVGYIPGVDGKVIGLSKLNRIVEFYARRPQVQENLTMQIHKHIDRVCEKNEGVAVMIEANHMCACVRGVKHDSTMKTSKLSGAFKDSTELARSEFYEFIRGLK